MELFWVAHIIQRCNQHGAYFFISYYRKPMTKLAYIFNRFPAISETFIRNEVETMAALGVDMELFSLFRPRKESEDTDSRHWSLQTHYVLDEIRVFGLLESHILLLRRFGRRYMNTLAFAWRNRTRKVLLKNLWQLRSGGDRASDINRKLRQDVLVHFLLAPQLAKAIVESGVTQIHAHVADAATSFALLVSLLTGIPYTFTAHAIDVFVEQNLMRQKIAQASELITCTRFTREFLLHRYPVETNGKTWSIYHGVRWREFKRTKKQRRAPAVILTVGRLVTKKGLSVLLEACKILKKRKVDFECWIVGDGPLRSKLELKSRLDDTHELVRFWGMVPPSRVKEFYESATVFVLPCIVDENGDRDGIPNVLIEAMAMELPAVSTTVSAIPELIEHGKNGFLAEEGDASSLASFIENVLSNPDRFRAMGRRARKKVISMFDPIRNVTEFKDVLDRVEQPR